MMTAQSEVREKERDLIVRCVAEAYEAYEALDLIPGVNPNGPALVWLAEQFRQLRRDAADRHRSDQIPQNPHLMLQLRRSPVELRRRGGDVREQRERPQGQASGLVHPVVGEPGLDQLAQAGQCARGGVRYQVPGEGVRVRIAGPPLLQG